MGQSLAGDGQAGRGDESVGNEAGDASGRCQLATASLIEYHPAPRSLRHAGVDGLQHQRCTMDGNSLDHVHLGVRRVRNSMAYSEYSGTAFRCVLRCSVVTTTTTTISMYLARADAEALWRGALTVSSSTASGVGAVCFCFLVCLIVWSLVSLVFLFCACSLDGLAVSMFMQQRFPTQGPDGVALPR